MFKCSVAFCKEGKKKVFTGFCSEEATRYFKNDALCEECYTHIRRKELSNSDWDFDLYDSYHVLKG